MAGTSAQKYESNFERITTPDLVAGYLRRLMDSHALLKVTVPDYREICSTVLVVINDAENFLVLDKLHPEPGHNAFMNKKQCRVHAQHQGVDMGFVAKFEVMLGGEDNPAYRITFPDELLYHQKRSAYRAPIGASKDIEVMLTTSDRSVYAGKLHNVSTGGLAVSVAKNVIEKIQPGDMMQTCRFSTEKGVTIETAAEVRNIKIDDDKKVYRIGMSFVEITPQELRAVQRFVLTLEREQIKRSR